MKRFYLVIISLCCFLLYSSVGTAQITVTNEDGDKIVIMPDGTWKYVDKGKEKERVKLEKIKDKKDKKKANEKPSTELNEPKSPEANKKVKLTRAAKRRLQAEEKRAKLAAKQAKKEAKANGTFKKEKKPKVVKAEKDKPAKTKSEKSKKSDKTVKDKVAKKDKSKVDKTTKAKSEKSDKTVKDKVAKKDTKKDDTKPKKVKAVKVKKASDKESNTTTKPKKDYVVVPQPLECSYAVNEIDPFTGKRKVATQEEFFFGFTNEELLRFMEGKNFIECYAGITQVGSQKMLKVKMIIDSPYAQKQYGGIQEKGKMMIRLINGKVITLISTKGSIGLLNKKEGKTEFDAYYIISDKDVKTLQKSEVNQIRFYWANGFEDYDVYEVDFLRNHLECLENADL